MSLGTPHVPPGSRTAACTTSVDLLTRSRQTATAVPASLSATCGVEASRPGGDRFCGAPHPGAAGELAGSAKTASASTVVASRLRPTITPAPTCPPPSRSNYGDAAPDLKLGQSLGSWHPSWPKEAMSTLGEKRRGRDLSPRRT